MMTEQIEPKKLNWDEDESKHITNFSISNFKKFEYIEMKNIGQFNIIVGDNNVGKTSLIEALLFDGDLDYLIICLHIILYYKNLLGVKKLETNLSTNWIELLMNRNLESNEIKIKTNLSDFYSLKINSKLEDNSEEYKFLYSWHGLGVNRYENCPIASLYKNDRIIEVAKFDSYKIKDIIHYKDLGMINFIPHSIGYESLLVKLYKNYISKSKKIVKEFINNLKSFIPNIESIQISFSNSTNESLLEIFTTDSDSPFPLSMMGDGANRLFRILLEIAKCRNQRLMIDEFDSGIHHSRFKTYWKTILQFAKSYNVQIFATTHNMECLTYFKEVLEDEDMKEFQDLSRIFSLQDIKGKSKIYTYRFKEFQACIDHDLEIR